MNNTPIDKSYEKDVGKIIEFKGKFAGSKGRKRSGMIQLVFKEVSSMEDDRPFRDHVCIFVSKEKAKKAGLHAGMTDATWEYFRFKVNSLTIMVVKWEIIPLCQCRLA